MEENENIRNRVIEILAVAVPFLFLTFITTKITSLSRGNVVVEFILDFCIIVLPVILIMTIGFNYLLLINLVLLLLSIFITEILENPGDVKLPTNGNKMAFVTNARSTFNLVTAVAILAVDFKIFPKTFQKSTIYGTSLMDLGVGLYVYANGLVASEIRGCRNSIWKTINNVTPLILIGVARFFITKQFGYKVSVIEYGKHWNFFITLAVTKLLSSIIMAATCCSMSFCAFLGSAILCLHQVLLNRWVEKLVFSYQPRDTFFLANREGIVSSLGFLGLYFLSIFVGFVISRKNKQYYELLLCTMLLGLSTHVLYNKFNISRGIANSTYCLWTVFIGTLTTTLFYLMEEFTLGGDTHVSFLYEAINYNGLTFFLTANLLTGLINIVFATCEMQEFYSILIISSYMLIVCLVVCFLYSYKIRIRFWESKRNFPNINCTCV